MAIRAVTGRGKPTIWRWQFRYMQDGADGLFQDAPRGRALAAALPEQVAAMVDRTLHEDPSAAMHWTLRSMAKASGLAPSTIHRIWRDHGLRSNRVETFKLSNDPKFVEKVRDIVGTSRGRREQKRPGIRPPLQAGLPKRGPPLVIVPL